MPPFPQYFARYALARPVAGSSTRAIPQLQGAPFVSHASSERLRFPDGALRTWTMFYLVGFPLNAVSEFVFSEKDRDAEL
ncbi:MAG TPA: hypothetical protein VG734_23060 [Lacunisphaera sp.]|nr:hypothetical protein [Lacunisphaera sp.]